MTPPRHREIACAILIDLPVSASASAMMLQGILQPAGVSLFGDHREGDETFLQCAIRKVHEEICGNRLLGAFKRWRRGLLSAV